MRHFVLNCLLVGLVAPATVCAQHEDRIDLTPSNNVVDFSHFTAKELKDKHDRNQEVMRIAQDNARLLAEKNKLTAEQNKANLNVDSRYRPTPGIREFRKDPSFRNILEDGKDQGEHGGLQNIKKRGEDYFRYRKEQDDRDKRQREIDRHLGANSGAFNRIGSHSTTKRK